MLGVRWAHKLHQWVVYEKDTDKILKRCDTEKEAKRAYNNLRSLSPLELKRRQY